MTRTWQQNGLRYSMGGGKRGSARVHTRIRNDSLEAPVAQLEQSIGFRIRGLWVRVLPGAPILGITA